MQIDTLVYHQDWMLERDRIPDKGEAAIVFLFGDSDTLGSPSVFDGLRARYPGAHVVGASSAGHILGDEIRSSPVVAAAVRFDKSRVLTSIVDLEPGRDVESLTREMAEKLPREGLRHVFVLSDGLLFNGSDLVRGLNDCLEGIPVTGGMAGDGDRFQQTAVVADAPARSGRIVAVGFYGDDLVISHGCCGGWSEFGIDRLITRSKGNVLYELDHEPVLDLYKKYLGDFAADLPNSGMRFPLSIKPRRNDPEVIRTLLAIDEAEKTITFAGDVPEGYLARLMKPDIDELIDGAKTAAESIVQVDDRQALGLVVSCTGRKIVMSQLVEEELGAVQEVLGEGMQLTGFYSYGELAPFAGDASHCQLHNQTMTLTAIYEK